MTGTTAGSTSDGTASTSAGTMGTTTSGPETTGSTGDTTTGTTGMTGSTGVEPTTGSTGVDTTGGDTTGGDTTGGIEPPPEWLLSINNQTRFLQKVSIIDAKTTDLCKLPNNTSYPSLTFSRDNILYASAGGTALDVIDPCTCEVTAVGPYGGGIGGVNGITSDQAIDLYGVASNNDVTISIDSGVGTATIVGPLGVDFGTGGATWSDLLQGLYAINGSDDWLYTIDPNNGMATKLVKLSFNFGTVGIELHPGNNVIYACSSGPDLYTVDPKNGNVKSVGKMAQTTCSNLAAPYKPVACIGP
ncbi:MAG: hypothetical protein H6710_14600 [Myxococcales bacterium]|nr:hypothetical protein [Myxococcales bacterium]MCB9702095.1 hypothetical protein [Myxococcales bacterium]